MTGAETPNLSPFGSDILPETWLRHAAGQLLAIAVPLLLLGLILWRVSERRDWWEARPLVVALLLGAGAAVLFAGIFALGAGGVDLRPLQHLTAALALAVLLIVGIVTAVNSPELAVNSPSAR